jgi:UrcA family protein
LETGCDRVQMQGLSSKRNTAMLKTLFTTVLLAAALPTAAPAELVTRQVHVTYADLDLRHAADVKQLDRRLRAAIGAVCPDTQPQERLIDAAVTRCRRTARAGFADQRQAALAAAYASTRIALNTPAH